MSSAVVAEVEKYLQQLDKYLNQYPILAKASDALSLRPFLIPTLAVGLIFLVLGRLEDVILGLVGFFYPAWSSFKAVESSDHEASKQWWEDYLSQFMRDNLVRLSYWVVYAAFSLVEIFSDIVLFWIPFYYVLKLLFLLWLISPHYQGAKIVYTRVLQPLFSQYRSKIDRAIDEITTVGGALISKTAHAAEDENENSLGEVSTASSTRRHILSRHRLLNKNRAEDY